MCADLQQISNAALAAEASELPEVLQSSDPAILADHLASLFSFSEGNHQLGCAVTTLPKYEPCKQTVMQCRVFA